MIDSFMNAALIQFTPARTRARLGGPAKLHPADRPRPASQPFFGSQMQPKMLSGY
jgi:hypothetical protein